MIKRVYYSGLLVLPNTLRDFSELLASWRELTFLCRGLLPRTGTWTLSLLPGVPPHPASPILSTLSSLFLLRTSCAFCESLWWAPRVAYAHFPFHLYLHSSFSSLGVFFARVTTRSYWQLFLIKHPLQKVRRGNELESKCMLLATWLILLAEILSHLPIFFFLLVLFKSQLHKTGITIILIMNVLVGLPKY